MEHSGEEPFAAAHTERRIALKDAIALARRSVSGITELKIDAVSHCERKENGMWNVVIDVLESHARLGDNDLLAAFEVHIDESGEVLYCSRTHRYHREDRSV